MHKPIYFREWWSQYGFWASVLFVVECFWLGTYGLTMMALLMPLSIVWSMATIVRLWTDRTAEMRFWRPYVFKWLAWWVLNALTSACVLAPVLVPVSALLGIGRYGQLAILLVFPMWRLCKHVDADKQELKSARYERRMKRFKAVV